METLKQTITLQNSCDIIGKSRDTFSPIKEALTNALDSISQRQKDSNPDSFTPNIAIKINFKRESLLLEDETCKLDYISVSDNGVGFTSENLERFKQLGEQGKGFNNRGTGKIQIFCRFNKISIDSIFFENNEYKHIMLSWIKQNNEYIHEYKQILNKTDRKTTVTMSDFIDNKNEQNFFIRYLSGISELKRDILKRFLLRLWLSVKNYKLTLSIQVLENEKEKYSFTFNESNIPIPDVEYPIYIQTQHAVIINDEKNNTKINWEILPENKNELIIRSFKLLSEDIDENRISMCSKDVEVKEFMFPSMDKNAVFGNSRYLTCISGEIFDNPHNVNQKVDSFTFRLQKDVEQELKCENISLFNPENNFILWDDIKTKISDGLSSVYADIESLKESRNKDISNLAKQYGISDEDVEAANIPFNSTDEEVTQILFKTQAKRFAAQSIEIQKTYKELRDLEVCKFDPTSEEYKTKLRELSSKLLEKIPQQNKDELARYIIRRDMVVELLRLALHNDLKVQKEWNNKKSKGERVKRDKEGIIHDLLFKRRMEHVPNDLWVLNEEFVHFDGYSDISLERIELRNGKKLLQDKSDISEAMKLVGLERGDLTNLRPDIFIYPEEGKCIIIELKATDEDLSKYCDQIQKYAKIIANYSTIKITQFYGFLIGENIGMIPDRYTKASNGKYWIYPDEPIKNIKTGEVIANLYQEIIQLSGIVERAKIRNKSFAEKLGIIDDNIENKISDQ